MSITESLILICYSFVESHVNLHELEESVLFNYLFWLYIYIVISNNTIKYVLILCKSNIETLCYLPKTVEQTGKDVSATRMVHVFCLNRCLIEGKEISWCTGVSSNFFCNWLVDQQKDTTLTPRDEILPKIKMANMGLGSLLLFIILWGK